MKSITKAVNKAIDLCGGQSALARMVGVSQPAVCKWSKGAQPRPHHCVAIERATNGRVTLRQLCPSFWQAMQQAAGASSHADRRKKVKL